jgi:tetratricopeptide (TPR) repeat protein
VSPFDLICAGRFEEALAACTRETESREQPQSLLHRETAHLRLGQHELAIADFRRAAALEPETMPTDAYEKRIGAAQWLQGREGEAVATWRDVVADLVRGRYSHSDAGGGIAARRQGDAARARALLAEAIASGMVIPLEIEYDLALHERRR